jgi:hypothetical protein
MAKKTLNKTRADRGALDIDKEITVITKELPKDTISAIPEPIREGILSGDIAHQIEEVKVSAKVSPTKKDEVRKFDAYYALTAQGMLILCGGKLEPQTDTKSIPDDATDAQRKELRRKGACDHFNYGRLLEVRQVERGILEDSIMGHEKAIDKQVKLTMDGGLFDSDDEARAHVIKQWKKTGRLPEDYVYPTAA